jgi:hypothetical protein
MPTARTKSDASLDFAGWTGPQHYVEAQACLARADRIEPSKLSRDLYAAAQVHATLALTAAHLATADSLTGVAAWERAGAWAPENR